MRTVRAPVLVLASAWLGLGCGGRTQTLLLTSDEPAGSGGAPAVDDGGAPPPASAGGVQAGAPPQAGAGGAPASAASCADLETAAVKALQGVVNSNNACNVDADCVGALDFGSCYTYCVLPVRRVSVHAVRIAGKDLCRSHVKHGCHLDVTCPNSAAVVCREGECALGF